MGHPVARFSGVLEADAIGRLWVAGIDVSLSVDICIPVNNIAVSSLIATSRDRLYRGVSK